MTEQIHIYDEPDYECSQETDKLSAALLEIFYDISMPKPDSENAHVKHKYASCDAYMHTLIPLLQKNGVLAVFCKGYLRASGQETLNLTLRHVKSGQWERYRSLLVKAESKMNSYQEDGSARTYQKRYMLREVFFMYDGDDNDTQTIKKSESYEKWISKENVAHIRSLLIGMGGEDLEKRICDHYKVDGLHKLPQSKYEEVIKIIKS